MIGVDLSDERLSADALGWTCSTAGVICADFGGVCQVMQSLIPINLNTVTFASPFLFKFPELTDISTSGTNHGIYLRATTNLTGVFFPNLRSVTAGRKGIVLERNRNMLNVGFPQLRTVIATGLEGVGIVGHFTNATLDFPLLERIEAGSRCLWVELNVQIRNVAFPALEQLRCGTDWAVYCGQNPQLRTWSLPALRTFSSSGGGISIFRNQRLRTALHPALESFTDTSTGSTTGLQLVELPALVGDISFPRLRTFQTGGHGIFVSNIGSPTVSFPNLTDFVAGAIGLRIDSNPELLSVSFDRLQTFSTSNNDGDGIFVSSNRNLTHVAFPALTTFTSGRRGIRIDANQKMTYVSFPVLTTFTSVTDGLYIRPNANLAAVDFPLLANITVQSRRCIDFLGNHKLSSVAFPSLTLLDCGGGIGLRFDLHEILEVISFPVLRTIRGHAGGIQINGNGDVMPMAIASFPQLSLVDAFVSSVFVNQPTACVDLRSLASVSSVDPGSVQAAQLVVPGSGGVCSPITGITVTGSQVCNVCCALSKACAPPSSCLVDCSGLECSSDKSVIHTCVAQGYQQICGGPPFADGAVPPAEGVFCNIVDTVFECQNPSGPYAGQVLICLGSSKRMSMWGFATEGTE